MKGSYILVIRLPRGGSIKTKGRSFELGGGYYVYVGSAMNSLEKRVERHFRKDKKLHWHIDFLLAEAELLGAYLIPSEERLEERISLEVGKYGEPVPDFGAGDVSVSTNLYSFEEAPWRTLERMLDRLGLRWKRVKNVAEIREVIREWERENKTHCFPTPEV
ncbi:GIY-YIG nuclease family protein [Palaeococcus ferrophilus]|uniref:GIY-YIG nuclease family protein n=1 Tax=Palaeococcus ferrophilus TaxID=83868 RepID=UPI00064FB1EA|nr:DUF123 domain-containing protein [Palaeococcus ferrophilus]